MVMATKRQRFKVTFSHGAWISVRFWMDKVLRKEAEGKTRSEGDALQLVTY